MFARRLPAAVLAASLTVVATTGCVRGRNDGGRDGAGLSSNGAGPAPQPGPLAGENTDTTMIAPAATPTSAGGTSGAPAAGTSTNAANGPGQAPPTPVATGAARGATKRP